MAIFVQPKNFTISVSPDERESFLAETMPRNDLERYVWYAFEIGRKNIVLLFADEIETAIQMADQAHLPDLAKRIRNGSN